MSIALGCDCHQSLNEISNGRYCASSLANSANASAAPPLTDTPPFILITVLQAFSIAISISLSSLVVPQELNTGARARNTRSRFNTN